MNPIIQKRYERLGATVVKALQRHRFEAYYVTTREEAVELGLSLIPAGSSISWGGAMTIDEIGLKDELRKGDYRLIDRDTAKTPEERVEMQRAGLLADVFLMSANAISADGQLVNIDGNGNRLAGLIYGPKTVLVFAGMNKVAATLEDALQRAQTVAAPINKGRFPGDTPCTVTGACGKCFSEDSVCAQVNVTRFSKPANRIKVILIGEDLGF